ncbi:dihydrofolate reductase [Vibrio parahaemolyticus]|nr:dihydrofolate reductase [Vibrio parahaemolyticus]EHU0344295.1 dihydrofolate reductase [Vibrio parahaemolyticus]EHU0354329.1 dihydrofolate reductase [Vibrio parahaemolyticus]
MIQTIFACGQNNEFGLCNDLPWHKCSEDMQFFRRATINTVCIMGHRTFMSMPKLEGRVSIVVSTEDIGDHSANTLEDAVLKAQALYPDMNISIIGGASIIKEAVDKQITDIVYKTEMHSYQELDADVYIDVDLSKYKRINTMNVRIEHPDLKSITFNQYSK